MPDKVRIGIVGTSWWTDFMFGPSLQSHPQAEMAAICGRDRGHAEEVAGKFAIPQVYTDYREMFAQGRLEAVVVATPDDTHHAITLEALRAGLHVLCDKPMAVTAQQAREMYAASETARVKTMILFTYRWMPAYRYLRDLIEQGYIGRCYHAEFRYLMGYARESYYSWRFDQARGNGLVADLGAHMIDMARWLVGDITRVQADLGTFVQRPGPDGPPVPQANDSAMLLLKFANGAHGTLQASGLPHIADRGMQQQVKLYGDKGTLEIDYIYGDAYTGATIHAARSTDESIQTLPIPDSYWDGLKPAEHWDVFKKHPAGARLFVDSILEDRPASPSFYDGYKAQQVIDAALESDRTGRAVTIAE